MIFSTSYPSRYFQTNPASKCGRFRNPIPTTCHNFSCAFSLTNLSSEATTKISEPCNHQPSSSIINHHQPSSTIVNHAFLVRSNDWWLLIRLIQVGAPNSILIGMTVLKAWSLVWYGGWLLGGFNPLEKYESKWESSPIFGVKIPKKYLSCHHLEDDQSDGPIVSAVEILLVFCGAPFGLPCPSKSNAFQWQLEVPGTVQSNRRERGTLWML